MITLLIKIHWKIQSSDGIGVKFVGDADENDPDAAAEAFDAIEGMFIFSITKLLWNAWKAVVLDLRPLWVF